MEHTRIALRSDNALLRSVTAGNVERRAQLHPEGEVARRRVEAEPLAEDRVPKLRCVLRGVSTSWRIFVRGEADKSGKTIADLRIGCCSKLALNGLLRNDD